LKMYYNENNYLFKQAIHYSMFVTIHKSNYLLPQM
jgi:hypothetical protein